MTTTDLTPVEYDGATFFIDDGAERILNVDGETLIGYWSCRGTCVLVATDVSGTDVAQMTMPGELFGDLSNVEIVSLVVRMHAIG